jgi:hypothetical protein
MAAGPGGFGQQRREALDPPVDGDVVDLHAAFGQQLLHVAVRQRKAQIPAHRQHDHIGREAEAGERRPCDSGGAGTSSSHGGSLPASDSITAAATVPLGHRGLDLLGVRGAVVIQQRRGVIALQQVAAVGRAAVLADRGQQ